jgi:hypothetical protein
MNEANFLTHTQVDELRDLLSIASKDDRLASYVYGIRILIAGLDYQILEIDDGSEHTA